MKRKPKVVIEGSAVNRDALSGRSFTVVFDSGITKVYPPGKRYSFSRVILFKVGMTLG